MAFRAFVAWVLFTSAAIAAEHQLRVLTSSDPIKGELVSVDAKNIVLKTADGNVTKPLAQVLQLDLQAPAQPSGNYTQVELTDGTILNCKPDGVTFNGKQVELVVLPDLKVQVPLKALSYILKDAQDPKVREHTDWKMLLKNRRTQDMFVKAHEGRLSGLGGTFTDGKGTVLNFLLEGRDEPVPLDLTKAALAGAIFVNKPDPDAPVTLCKFLDINQNLLMVAKLEAKEGGDFAVTTVAGAKLTCRRDLVVRLDYSRGKLTYLSEIDPIVQNQLPEDFFDRRYVRDKTREGNPLQLNGQRFTKGLFVPVSTKLEYTIGGDYNEFTAQVGVDEGVPGKVHVRLVIEGDGKVLFPPPDDKGEFKRGDKPRQIKLNVKDIQKLTIAVEPADPLNLFGQHLDLADAKINK
jgi:hypothetical protein